MLSSKTKTGLSETLPNKSTPATPRVSKLAKGPTRSDSNSSSPSQNPRLSIDRSPRSVDSKPAVDRRSPKPSTPDKQQRVLKGSELQAQLGSVQEDLKKAKERLATTEKEKVRVLEELKQAKRLAEEANEKLSEALVTQKRAEESSEIEKFRADELEQAGIEAAQKREEEWQKELESVRSQHALDVAALLSATQELQRVKHELSMTTDAKNTALSHADDAMKIAEINAEKVELLSNELGLVKAVLDSKLEAKSNETSELVKKLNLEIDSLKQELERAKTAEKKVEEMKVINDALRSELEEAQLAESNLSNLADEWKKKAESFETQVDEVTLSEKFAAESLASSMKQLELNNALLLEKESEIASLRGVIESLEISAGRHKEELEESNQLLEMGKKEALERATTVDNLRSELDSVKAEKAQALNNEMAAISNVQCLLEEKNKLMIDLEVSRDEEGKSKKAMESLASALHEVSTEARETKEKLSTAQFELENAEIQFENWKSDFAAAKEKYEAVIDEAKEEIDHLTKSVEISQLEAENLKTELKEKELEFVASIKKSEEEIFSVRREMDRLAEDSKTEWEVKELGFVSAIRESEQDLSTVKREVERLLNLLNEKEEEARATKEDNARLVNNLEEALSETNSAKEFAEKTLAESLKLKERLLDKENELQSITQENEELRSKEAVALEKGNELSKLLEEALARKIEENGDLSNSEKDYDLLPKMEELVDENVDGGEMEKPKLAQPEKHKGEGFLNNTDALEPKQENMNGEAEEDDFAEVEAKMWDNCKINEKDLSPEREPRTEAGSGPEPESFEEDVDSKIDGDGYDQINGQSTETMENGGTSPTKQQLKKKKALLRKFGNLLKKKTNAK
ncbi:WEB family protein At3g02930, chloroplastic-like [Aristolochia californica]|uniref:WEB family protein At3g02930, chloroplastic-like n=1 Tax=Aristolochia californica TaxID=171875 RepID=UPI0035D5451C